MADLLDRRIQRSGAQCYVRHQVQPVRPAATDIGVRQRRRQEDDVAQQQRGECSDQDAERWRAAAAGASLSSPSAQTRDQSDQHGQAHQIADGVGGRYGLLHEGHAEGRSGLDDVHEAGNSQGSDDDAGVDQRAVALAAASDQGCQTDRHDGIAGQICHVGRRREGVDLEPVLVQCEQQIATDEQDEAAAHHDPRQSGNTIAAHAECERTHRDPGDRLEPDLGRDTRQQHVDDDGDSGCGGRLGPHDPRWPPSGQGIGSATLGEQPGGTTDMAPAAAVNVLRCRDRIAHRQCSRAVAASAVR